MNYSDLIQFKDEVLKNLRELEKKIMSKVNKNQEDISSDLNTINQSLNFMRTSSNSMIDSINILKPMNNKRANANQTTTNEATSPAFLPAASPTL